MHYVVRPWERAAFKRCRRAWDLAATERRNYEPTAPVRPFDPEAALREALAVYYFPGMWDWGRAIVRPLVLDAYATAVRRQREAAPRADVDWDGVAGHGRALLERYFEWAPGADQFTPVQVAVESDVTVPDPREPDRDLVVGAGRDARYRARGDVVVVDPHDTHWLLQHHVVDDRWSGPDELVLDDHVLSVAWAWERAYLGTLAGTIVNELRWDADPPPVAASQLRPRVVQSANSHFRRTQVPRERQEIDGMGQRLAAEMLEMTDAELAPYPSPSEENCAGCAYRRPCLAMRDGSPPDAELAAGYRPRRLDEFEPGRLGAVWGFHTGPR